MTEPSQYFKGRTVQEQMDEVISYVDVRAAEVATTAIASDVAQVHQDMLDADADAQAAAASAAAAAGTLANAVKKTGEASQSIAGDIAVSGDLSATGDLSVGGTGAFIGDVTVPTETTGQFTAKAANSMKVKNELDNYATMVRTANNQIVGGVKTFTSTVMMKTSATPGGSSPGSYASNAGNFRIIGSDDLFINGIGFEKSTTGSTRMVIAINGNKDPGTGNQIGAQIHFIFDPVNGVISMQPARIDVNGVRTFGTAQQLMTWTP